MKTITVLKIAYLPDISLSTKAIIRTHVNPSMTSEDSNQYDITLVIEFLEKQKESEIDMNDLIHIREMNITSKISYLEF